jgi:transposase-like protein
MTSTKEPDMSKKRRSFPVELKQFIVREIETGALSLSGAARKYEVSPTAIIRWRDKSRAGELTDNPSAKEKALEKEVRELKEKVGDLTMQIDLLKKVEAYGQRLRKLDSCTITGLNWEQFRKGAK